MDSQEDRREWPAPTRNHLARPGLSWRTRTEPSTWLLYSDLVSNDGTNDSNQPAEVPTQNINESLRYLHLVHWEKQSKCYVLMLYYTSLLQYILTRHNVLYWLWCFINIYRQQQNGKEFFESWNIFSAFIAVTAQCPVTYSFKRKWKN